MSVPVIFYVRPDQQRAMRNLLVMYQADWNEQWVEAEELWAFEVEDATAGGLFTEAVLMLTGKRVELPPAQLH